MNAEGATAPEAWTFSELQRIRATRLEADLAQAHASAFPETRRFETMGYRRYELEAPMPLSPSSKEEETTTQPARTDIMLANGIRVLLS